MKLTGKKETRSSVRIAAGRPARIYFKVNDEEISIHADVIDISASGCRFIVRRERLPFDGGELVDKELSVKIDLDQVKEIDGDAVVIWDQIFQREYLIVGVKFTKIDKINSDKIINFILHRDKAGLEIMDEKDEDKSSPDMEIPDMALEVECTSREVETPHPYHFVLHSLSQTSMEFVHAPKENEEKLQPVKGDNLDITVFPPSWADNKLRTIRFVGRVRKTGELGAIIDFCSVDHDLKQMILNLIPKPQKEEDKTKEVNYFYFVVLLLILIAWLLAKA
ncbi:MAG: PilZ domain-containing protein [Planctomycetota bacterium]|jgi:hypothetical protein